MQRWANKWNAGLRREETSGDEARIFELASWKGVLVERFLFFLVSGGISSFATGLCFENTYIVIVCIYNFGIRKNLRKGMEERGEIESN